MSKGIGIPTLLIGGTTFVVDVINEEIKERANLHNVIRFEDMADKGSHYSFSYDLNDKNIPVLVSRQEHIIEVNIPQMVELDPELVAEKYKVSVESLKGKRDLDLIVDPQLLQKRLNGELPTILIGTDTYIVDWYLKELRAPDDPGRRISLANLEMNAEGTEYICFFDTLNKVVVPAHDIKQHSGNLAILVIPYEIKLDPVGVAREYGMEDTALLRKYPIEKVLKAQLMPVHMPLHIPLNQKQQQGRRLKIKRGRRI